MFSKLSRWFNNLPLWDVINKHTGCTVVVMVVVLVIVFWLISVCLLRLLLGGINTAFSFSFTDTQLWVGAVGLCVLAWLFGGKGVTINKK